MTAQRCSHGRARPPRRVSPCLQRKQGQSASTLGTASKQGGGCSIYEMHSGFFVRVNAHKQVLSSLGAGAGANLNPGILGNRTFSTAVGNNAARHATNFF
jgi:hypothetical protein